MKRIIYLILVILWLGVIFMFSSQNGEDSGNTSKELIIKIVNVYEKITNKEVDMNIAIEKMQYPIRKLAHFTEYFILGIFMFLFINTYNFKNKLLITIGICFICASFDEIHQIFSDNRGPSIIDVFIDTFGSIVSSSILKKNN